MDKLSNTKALIIATPTYFSTGYPELKEPVGILKIIKDNGAFVAGSDGENTRDDIEVMSDRIMTLPSKRGLNCFSNTDLQPVLQANGIQDVIIAVAMTSLCIDTAGREAYDLGYRVHILKDCTDARTAFERKFYTDEIMPPHAEVVNSLDIECVLDW
jgi:nicotinamidase-related amidase